MVKSLGYFIILLVVLGVVAFLAWTRVPDWLSHRLSKQMKVTVEIDDIKLGLSNITVDDFQIGNVRGGVLPKAFTAEIIVIDAPLPHYLNEHIVIDQITVNNVYLGLEFSSSDGSKGNWTVILGNLKSASGGTKSSHDVLIKRLVLNNIVVDAVFNSTSRQVSHLKPIKRLEFTNVTSERGIPSSQIAQSVLTQMLQSVFLQENLQNMLQDIITNPPQGVEQLLRGLF